MLENHEFSSIRIGLASPEMIRDWSYGEVKKPETINYRTLKAEPDGLFCEKIFGPTKDGACFCGKYKNYHSKEVVRCEKCGVDVTTKKVRRERMGHIELASPVSHIWYFKGIPSRMALALDISPKQLEQVLYYAQNIVLDPGNVDSLKKGDVLTEKEYADYRYAFGNSFRTGMGAEAIKELLRGLDEELPELSRQLKEELSRSSGQKKVHIIKRLEAIESFRKSGNKLEWMILDVIPVLPPDIRPMVQLDGGRFASSDLNELYRRVIARNNRLKKLLELHTPQIMLTNEKRMLQEAVDALIDNGKHGKPVTGASSRTLKSLSEMLRGKQGRFRQNLLGKRVDYSGRSVIVVGPNLKIYQCGLPKEMALELFKPFVIKRLVEMGKATNIKDAQKKIDRVHPDVWDALENVIKEHPVLLNRAPTLHRLSIQAFEPVLVDGRAIKLHPLVCTAFNADFDGDQMPVHVPLSAEAQAEARFLMLSANNLLKPMDGKTVTVPTQDMVLGSYYLTMEKEGEPGDRVPAVDENGNPITDEQGNPVYSYHIYRNFDEAMMAYSDGLLGLHAKIKVRVEKEINGVKKSGVIVTTLGRLIFNNPIPQDLGLMDRSKPENELRLEVDTTVKKGDLGKIIDNCIRIHGPATCATMLDAIKEQGYHYSTKASLSISVYDISIPPEKSELIEETQKKIDKYARHYLRGELSNEERYNNVIAVWKETVDKVTNALTSRLDPLNPINIMSDSGARGSIKQLRQLGGMRGLMFAANGTTIEIPIKSNFREGMKIHEYFMGARSSRKSLSDTALRTADSGYLTRRLVDVSSSVIVREEKCDTDKGDWISRIPGDGNKDLETLQERITGRYTFGPVVDPKTGEVLLEDDMMITADQANAFVKAGIEKVCIRTVFHCNSRDGICAHCYGSDLATGNPVQIGEAVGIIAAQSIGEPGTQLTMRTFHSGGVAGSDITQGLPRVEELFEARPPKKPAVITNHSGIVDAIQDNNTPVTIEIESEQTGTVEEFTVPYGSRISVHVGDHVNIGDALTEGSKAPLDIMKIQGLDAVYEYLITEVQKVYRSQDCNVNDKHIEIIARQMTRKYMVKDGGDTDILTGTVVDQTEFQEENKKVQERIDNGELNLRLAEGEPMLLGISKAALQTESFLSAASFQETTKVLTEAAIRGKVDRLLGLKENVIIGKLIPAGTGMTCYKDIDVRRVDEDKHTVLDDEVYDAM
ncbi:MAG: DNA-directed RNA polymerase subunit beta' [Clostridia bacterium]|nr:DNA-directed RNA polymerase subunit beta' [Clostridia bacterium]